MKSFVQIVVVMMIVGVFLGSASAGDNAGSASPRGANRARVAGSRSQAPLPDAGWQPRAKRPPGRPPVLGPIDWDRFGPRVDRTRFDRYLKDKIESWKRARRIGSRIPADVRAHALDLELPLSEERLKEIVVVDPPWSEDGPEVEDRRRMQHRYRLGRSTYNDGSQPPLPCAADSDFPGPNENDFPPRPGGLIPAGGILPEKTGSSGNGNSSSGSSDKAHDNDNVNDFNTGPGDVDFGPSNSNKNH